ncbi:MAG TPA: tryptophan synthase subunit alpha, partial [Gemmatimonadaceae bacterium]
MTTSSESSDADRARPGNLIDKRFAELKAARRRALVPYITAGHPDEQRTIELLQGLEAAGADVVELGLPFSDPMADGPI